MVALATLGRRARTGPPATAAAAGNAAVTSDARGAAAARPGSGNGLPRSSAGRLITTPPWQLGRSVRTPPTQHDRLIARDRHIVELVGTSRASSDPRPAFGPAAPNPLAVGPPRPAGMMLDRTVSWQVGTDHTTNLDNEEFHASTTAGARRFPLGNQGSTPWQPRYGGTPGLYRPYGTRGHVQGPPPRIVAQPGGPWPKGTLLDPGSTADGPQLVYGGRPHGRHTQTVPPVAVTRDRQRHIPTQRGVRQWRPENSKIAGQSYSQTVVHQSGKGGGRLPRIDGGRQAGTTTRFLRRQA